MPTKAKEAGGASSELAPIIVDTTRPGEPELVERSFDTSEDLAGFGETIFAEPTWRGFANTAELLGQSVGAHLKRQGGRDDFSTLTIRGAPAAQLRILLDGIALGRASDSVVNLANLPMDTVERIEVYRGFAPVGLTPVSAAGVVNIITRDPKKAAAGVAAGGGSFGSAKVHAGGAGPVAGGSAAAFASYRHTDGDFEYEDDNGTLNNPADDFVHKRENNDADTVESLVRWRRGLTDTTQLQLRNHVFYKEEGVPGLARLFLHPQARLETVREIAAASAGSRDGRWSIEEAASWQSQKLSDFDFLDNTAETTASTTTGRWSRPLGKSNWLSGSSEYTWEGFEQRNEAASLPPQHADRSLLAIAAGDDWSIKSIYTTLSLQLRHQQIWNDSSAGTGNDSSDHSTDPRLGLRWEPLAGFAIKSNVSTYFRPPNFDELYGTNGFTTGNPALRPETGLAWDAGFEWKFTRDPLGSFALGYSYFGSDIDDVILIQMDFRREAKAFNAQKAAIRGHEARVEWKGPAGVALSANYTFQDAQNLSSAPALHGRELPGIPKSEAWTRLNWTRGPLVVAYDLELTGSLYRDSENMTRKQPTRTVHSLSVVLGPFWKEWRLTFEADNLGDSLVPDEVGFPLPGRAFYATLSWSMASQDDDAG